MENFPKLMPVFTACLFVAGCQTLPVVPHAIKCGASAELLASKCAAPTPLPNNSTYATLVDTMQMDRKALQECSVVADTLRDTLKQCIRATEEFNNRIDTLNSAK